MKKCMSLSTARIFLMTLLVSLTLSLPALADTPSRVQVGIFFNSMEDCTDSVYVSFNGEKFQKVGEVLRETTLERSGHTPHLALTITLDACTIPLPSIMLAHSGACLDGPMEIPSSLCSPPRPIS